MSSQHPVRLLVAEDLHHAIGVGVGFGSAVGREGELADSVRDALRRRGAESDCETLPDGREKLDATWDARELLPAWVSFK